jgi:hypothetical protein
MAQIKWMFALIISICFVIGFDGTFLKAVIVLVANVLRVKFVFEFQFLSLVPFCGIWY